VFRVSSTIPLVETAGPFYADSDYSLGTIQVDLGQRGTGPVDAISGRSPKPGEGE